MLDIAKNDLIISQLHHVTRSHMSKKRIEHKEGRHWDGLIYILNGSCHMTFSDGSSFTTVPGALVYLAKDSLYNMDILEEPYEVIFADFLFDSPEPRQSAIYLPNDREETLPYFLRMKRAYSLKSSGYLSECLSLLYRIYAKAQAIASQSYLPSPSRKKIEEARNVILESYAAEELSVAALAVSSGMSEVYFRRLFRTGIGCSPSEFIVQTRLNAAKSLMRYSDLSLEEIALQSGFSSLSYFCRVFKEHTDMTPSAFRAISKDTL